MPLTPYRDDTSLLNIDLSNPINWDHPLNRGLAAWWLALPQWSGGSKWYDLVGKNDGTLTNGPVWVGVDRSGGVSAVSFDGVDDIVDVPHTGDLTFTGQFTVAAWARSTGVTRFAYLGGKADPGDWNGYYITIHDTTGLPTVYSLQASTFQSANVSTVVKNDKKWHLIVGTFDGTQLRCYLDGVGGSAAAASAPTSNTSPFRIGSSNVTGRRFTGQIADVRMYGRGLSAAEVASLYDLSRQSYSGVLNRTPIFFALSANNETASGGATVGSSAFVSVSFAPAASGGSLAGGNGSASLIRAEVIASVGTLAGGQAEVAVRLAPVSSGGSTAAGSALITAGFQQTGSGGAVSAGTADYVVVFGSAVSGGTLLGGAAAEVEFTFDMAGGGVLVSSAAMVGIGQIASGGAVAAGTAIVFVTFVPVMVGGVEAAGSAAMENNVVSRGGCRLGGTAPNDRIIPHRYRYARFRIGESVYVPSPVADRYLLQGVRDLFTVERKAYYDVGIGWFPDDVLLSHEQYRNWLRRRASRR
jgi:hypothetical protein